MRPTKENLTALVGKNIEMDIRLSCRPENSENGYLEKQYGVTLLERDGKVVLTRDDSSVDAGVWVPYAETKAVVGRYTGSGVGWHLALSAAVKWLLVWIRTRIVSLLRILLSRVVLRLQPITVNSGLMRKQASSTGTVFLCLLKTNFRAPMSS